MLTLGIFGAAGEHQQVIVDGELILGIGGSFVHKVDGNGVPIHGVVEFKSHSGKDQSTLSAGIEFVDSGTVQIPAALDGAALAFAALDSQEDGHNDQHTQNSQQYRVKPGLLGQAATASLIRTGAAAASALLLRPFKIRIIHIRFSPIDKSDRRRRRVLAAAFVR